MGHTQAEDWAKRRNAEKRAAELRKYGIEDKGFVEAELIEKRNQYASVHEGDKTTPVYETVTSLEITGGTCTYTDENGTTQTINLASLYKSRSDVFGQVLAFALEQSGLDGHLPNDPNEYRDALLKFVTSVEEELLERMRPFMNDKAFDKIDRMVMLDQQKRNR